MNTRLTGMLVLLGICLFCGFIVFTVGIGSMYPPMNRVAGPIVCGSQPMEIIQRTYSYRPGDTTWSVDIFCVDPDTGAKVDRTFLAQLVSGMIYGVALFVLIELIAAGLALRRKLMPAEAKQDEKIDDHR